VSLSNVLNDQTHKLVDIGTERECFSSGVGFSIIGISHVFLNVLKSVFKKVCWCVCVSSECVSSKSSEAKSLGIVRRRRPHKS
jgi:hypothetical protein